MQKTRSNKLPGVTKNPDRRKPSKNQATSKNAVHPVVCVVVITYNQERYIAECLESILSQEGDFKIELIIGDDCSTDNTMKIIRKTAGSISDNKIEVKILTTDKNIGMTKNLQRCFNACEGSYIAVCEGDDYWIDPKKLQKQINFLQLHPECAFCFNDIYMYFQERGEFVKYDLQQQLDADVITTEALVVDYYIGNLSCCMYDAQFMNRIPKSLFDLYIGDWMFNIYYSQFGKIGHVKEIMSVYRKHVEGVWAGGDPKKLNLFLWEKIEEYNRFLNFKYDREFFLAQKRIELAFPDEFLKRPVDLAIIDDAFPHPLSAFRVQEFSSYLSEFTDIRIFSSGNTIGFLGGGKTLDELIADFKRESPQYSRRIRKLEADTIISAKLFYMDFLINAYANIERIEKLATPFVFTLYPGGGFGLNVVESDRMLRRVTSSPCFRKVIVTQKVTYDYLVNNYYCTPDQIEFIFGVVTPLKYIEAGYTGKKHFGIEKNTLDICFVAYKYTEKAIDKGYDVFIDVARRLYRKYTDIHFHVVGGIEEKEINVKDLKGRISFYGKRDIEWFDDFYRDKDIILSPNISGRTYPGSFDGFPTGSCVDAGLRKTAIFCTDELGLNKKFFFDRQDIVIIPHDSARITSIIESYYHDSGKLKKICEAGSLRIKLLYSYKAQILPRINLLKNEIENAERSKKAIVKAMNTSMQKRENSMEIKPESTWQNSTFSIQSMKSLLLGVVEPSQVPDEARRGRVWKMAVLLRRIFIKLAPIGSRRARLLKQLYNIYFVRFIDYIKDRKTKGDWALIRSSGLFDQAWYLENNPDVAQAMIDPIVHYVNHGGFEGLDPGPKFSSQEYLNANEDVKKAGVNPLVHYLKYGRAEGRVTQPYQSTSSKGFYICPVCQKKVEAFSTRNLRYEENWEKYVFLYNFDDFETLTSSQYFCPNCGASEEDRLNVLYLTRMIDQYLSWNSIKVLDIAPATPQKRFLRKYPKIPYQIAEEHKKDFDFIDITNVDTIAREAYDFFICSHVLECVEDDRKALSELFRILKPGGSGILMVLINLRIDKTREDPTVTDIGERWRRFGQDDHIRLYSKKGFIERVEEAGFTINRCGVDYFGKDVFSQHGISPKSILYIVQKN